MSQIGGKILDDCPYTACDGKGLRKKIDELKLLQHEYDSTRGLWCIDRDPKEVDIEWIRKNAFQLKDTLKKDKNNE